MSERRERLPLNALLFTAALAAAPNATHVPLWLVLVCAGGFVWRLAIAHLAWPAPGRWLRLALTALVVVASARYYGTLLGRDVGTGLLVGLLALKLLELGRARDYVVAVLLCYLLLLANFLYDQSSGLALYSVLAVLASVATLVALHRPGAADLRHDLRLAGALLLKGVPLALAMFFLFPRVEGRLWGLPIDTHSTVVGLSDVLRPGSINRLITSDAPAFRVRFEGDSPKAAELYWRALVLWQTDGRRWVRGEPRAADAVVKPFAHLGAPLKYSVALEPNDRPWMPALDLPITAPIDARAHAGYVFEHRTPVREPLSYALVSYPHYRTGTLEAAEHIQALQLPERVSARVRALAERWRLAANDNVEIAQAALAYFRNEPFFYTLDPPVLGEDPVDEFLFSTRRGFCGHFASAFVTLMRAAGVPSRIVAGYLGGEYNPAGDYWIVRQEDAHAWAEIWTPAQGWLRVDPTAAVAPERVEFGIDAVRELALRGVQLGRLPAEAVRRLIELGWLQSSWQHARLYLDAANISWHRWVVDYDRQRQQQLLHSLRLPSLSWHSLLAVLLLVTLCALVALGALTRRVPKRDSVQALYQRFCRKLERVDLKRAPTEGALAFSRRAAVTRPDLKPALDDITALYLQLRYAGLPAAPRMRALRRALRQFRPRTRNPAVPTGATRSERG